MICDEQALLTLAARLAKVVKKNAVIYLHGELGAGKTAFVRGFMRGLGYQDKVKSPTYTLVEPYLIADKQIYHFDLYRLSHPEELEFIGYRDYFNTEAIYLIEWPEKAANKLPPADIDIIIEIFNQTRKVSLQAHSKLGKTLIKQLNL